MSGINLFLQYDEDLKSQFAYYPLFTNKSRKVIIGSPQGDHALIPALNTIDMR